MSWWYKAMYDIISNCYFPLPPYKALTFIRVTWGLGQLTVLHLSASSSSFFSSWCKLSFFSSSICPQTFAPAHPWPLHLCHCCRPPFPFHDRPNLITLFYFNPVNHPKRQSSKNVTLSEILPIPFNRVHFNSELFLIHSTCLVTVLPVIVASCIRSTVYWPHSTKPVVSVMI